MDILGIPVSRIVTWLIVGALAGTLLGRLFKGSRAGFGVWTNLWVGLVGALIGGVIFRVLQIDLGLGEIRVTAEDLVAALLGTLLFLAVLALRGRRKKKARPE